MPPPSLAQVKKLLLDHVEGFFNSQSDLFPDLWDVHLGLFLKDKPVSPDARTKRLGLATPYFFKYDTTAVTVTELPDFTKFVFDAPNVFAGNSFTPPVDLFVLERRADFIWDTKEELLASRFPYYEVVTQLSHATRVKAYGTLLGAIRKPESDSPAGPLKGFFEAASQNATYDHTDDFRNYYSKWLAAEPKKAEERIFQLDKLSDQYLKLNFTPLELQRDRVYLLIFLGDIFVLFQLFFSGTGKKRRLNITLWKALGITDDRNVLSLISKNYPATVPTPLPKMFFVYALDGSDGLPGWLSPVRTGKIIFPDQEVIDPRYHVKQVWNIPHEDPDPSETKNWAYKDWVKELIRVKFSDQWLWLRDNPYGGRNTPRPDREKLFLKEIRDAAAESKGETRKKLLNFIREAEGDKHLYMVRRGSKNSDYLRIIGSDEHYVYLYHKNIEIIIRINQETYFEDYFAIGLFAKVIYQNTAWIIPFAKIISWGGVAVMGAGIFGTAALAQGARSYLSERISSAALKPAIQKLLRKFETELVLMFVNAVLAFFPKTRNTALVRGFLTGYTTDTFEALFSKWYSLASLEPTSYKVLKYTYQFQAALGRLDDKLSLIKSSVDDQTAKILEDRFVKFLVSAWQAIIMLTHSLYYLDYDQIKPLLDILAKAGAKAPTTKQEWDRFRHENMLKCLLEFDKVIKDAKVDVADVYGDVQKAVQSGRKAFWLANVAFSFNKASGGMLTDIVVLGPLVGLGIGAAAVTNFQTTYKVASKTVSLFIDELMQLEKYGPKEMEQFGRLLGKLVGALTINKKLFGPKMSLRERWKIRNLGRRVKESLIHGELGLGFILPLIKLLLFHYVIMIEGVIDASKQVKARWDTLQDEIEVILFGDPNTWDIFPPDEESVNLEKIARIIVKLDEILTDWLKDLGKIPDLQEKIKLMVAKLKTTTPPQVPSLEDIIDGKVGAEWSQKALTFLMFWGLHAALKQFVEALQYFTETTNPKGPVALSIAGLFELLGFQLNSDQVSTILDSNMDDLTSTGATP